MIEFSAVRAVRVPAGNVVKITQGNNEVWSKGTDTSMVTVVLGNAIQASYQGVKANGTMLTEAGQVASVLPGTAIELYGYQGVWEDGVLIGNNYSPGDYVSYTVQYNIKVFFSGNGVVAIEKVD